MGLNIASGRATAATSACIDGAIAFPMPHKKTPLLSDLSISFRSKILVAVSPASVPNRVQQNIFGRGIKTSTGSVTYNSLLCIIMQNTASQLRAFMQKKGLGQQQLAKAANVSQSTVSRALQGKFERTGAARIRLFKYAGISDWSEGDRHLPQERVMRAFDRVWDHSEEHAVAIAKVIDALSGLRPVKDARKRSGGD